MIKILTCLLGASASLLLILPLQAVAKYPEKPVEFVIPFPPGDLEDVLTRMIADEFQAAYGVPAAVINKPGGGGGPFPGAAYVAQAKADGYTIGSFVVEVPIVGPAIGIPALNPNPFDPVGIFLTYPFVIAASKNAPYSTVAELADYAQTHKVVLGHFGAPLLPTRVTFALADHMGFEYASDAAFDALDCNTLASGDVDVINTTLQLIRPCLDKVNVLASIGTERTALTPDAPTVMELAPQLGVALWNGLFVHKDTPADVREKIAAVASKVMQSDAAKKLATETGALIYWQDTLSSVQQIKADTQTLDRIDNILN